MAPLIVLNDRQFPKIKNLLILGNYTASIYCYVSQNGEPRLLRQSSRDGQGSWKPLGTPIAGSFSAQMQMRLHRFLVILLSIGRKRRRHGYRARVDEGEHVNSTDPPRGGPYHPEAPWPRQRRRVQRARCFWFRRSVIPVALGFPRRLAASPHQLQEDGVLVHAALIHHLLLLGFESRISLEFRNRECNIHKDASRSESRSCHVGSGVGAHSLVLQCGHQR